MTKKVDQLKPHQFKKGQSGNPSGVSTFQKINKNIQHMKFNEFIDLLNKCAYMNRDEISAWLKRPEATMFELMFGGLVASAAKGDKQAYVLLTDRLFGKVKEQSESLVVSANANLVPTFEVLLNNQGKFLHARPREVTDEKQEVYDVPSTSSEN